MKHLLLAGIIATFALAGCNNVSDTTLEKDASVAVEEKIIIPTTEENKIEVHQINDDVDMSEYVKKSDVESMIETAVNSAVENALNEALASNMTERSTVITDGKDGVDGRGISSAVVDNDGNLLILYTDGTLVNVGNVKGPKGDKGDKGDAGSNGSDGKDGTTVVSNIDEETIKNAIKSVQEESKSTSESDMKAAQEAADAAAAAQAAQAAAGTVTINCKDGTGSFTKAEYDYFVATWSYTGMADEMMTHHTIDELHNLYKNNH